MKRLLFVFAAVAALSGSMHADTISSIGTVTGTWLTTSSGFTTQAFNGANPGGFITTEMPIFWNDPSYDALNGNKANIGDVLTGQVVGNVLGSDTAVVGGNLTYFGQNVSGSQDPIGSSGGTTPLAFNFVRNATAYNISVLFSDSSMNSNPFGTVFGTYSGSTFTPIYGAPGNNLTGTPNNTQVFNASGTYGFYATVCYANNGIICTNSETYTTGNGNSGTATGGQAWNHFAVFQLASGSYVIGLEDGNGLFAEGIGDFNDIIVELAVVSPEPGTMAFMGLGLAGLGLLTRRRFAKK